MIQPSLKALSDQELQSRIQKLVSRERSTTIDILLHLNEVERRRLYLKLGYSSLFDYCTRHLNYSDSGAGRRVQVARCIRRHPDVLELLRARKVNFTTVSLIASIINDKNKDKLLSEIGNAGQKEVERIASDYRPPVALRDRVKPVRVRVPAPEAALRAPLESPRPRSLEDKQPACEKSNYSHSGSAPKAPPTRIEQKLLIQLVANEAFIKKYEEVRALLSQRLSNTSFENVFDAVLSEFLDRHSPYHKKARREKRRAKAKKTRCRRPAKTRASRAATHAKPKRSRAIPAAVRDKVGQRRWPLLVCGQQRKEVRFNPRAADRLHRAVCERRPEHCI